MPPQQQGWSAPSPFGMPTPGAYSYGIPTNPAGVPGFATPGAPGGAGPSQHHKNLSNVTKKVVNTFRTGFRHWHDLQAGDVVFVESENQKHYTVLKFPFPNNEKRLKSFFYCLKKSPR